MRDLALGEVIPAMRPLLPTAKALIPYLERIDERRVYSNFGPLYFELVERLSKYLDVGEDNVALFANGTLALQAAIETVGDQGDTWVVPSYTFVATAQAVHAARRKIHFADVAEESWALEGRERPFATGHVVVAPFGSRPPLSQWCDVSGWKVFDAASCFDSCHGIGSLLDEKSSLMISLHATKTLPAGEGALLVGPSEWIRQARSWGNFGFNGSRSASGPGLNAKLSEYHSAVGLASLDGWNQTRRHLAQRSEHARAICEGLDVVTQPSLGDGWVTTTWNIRLRKPDLPAIERALAENGIQTRRWWPSGVHEMPLFRGCTKDLLPVTSQLANQVLGLPFAVDLSVAELNRISLALKNACRE